MLSSARLALATVLLTLSGLSTLLAQRIDHPPRASAGDIATATHYEAQPFDVLHYDVSLDLTAAPSLVTHGSCTVTLVWRESGPGPFRFHLASLRVDSAFYEGAPAQTTLIDSADALRAHYEIVPPAPVTAGDTVEVRIDYSGTMTHEPGTQSFGGVFSSGALVYAIGVGFRNSYVSTTRHWFPCYDHPSDKATFRGHFRIRNGRTVASNGMPVDVMTDTDSTEVITWRTDIPTATYLLTFATDRYTSINGTAEGHPTVLFTLPADSVKTALSFKLLPQMVAGFERRYIPYPFEKVGYVNTPIGAMEHQTMISYPTSLSRRGDTVNSVAAHELAHQWFGDLVTPLDFRHVWLTESFATHAESEWEEERGGFAAYLDEQGRKVEQYFNYAAQEGTFSIYDFPRATPNGNYPRTVYEKGAVVLGMLRYEIGDTAYYGALREYLRTNAYSTAVTDSMQATMERHAGRSLGWFFDEWIRWRGWPIFEIGVAAEGIGGGLNTVTVSLRQTSTGDSLFRNVPVEISFIKSGVTVASRVVRASDSLTVVTLDSIPDYTSITINKGPSVRSLLQVGSLSAVERAELPSPLKITAIPNPVVQGTRLHVQVSGASRVAGRINYALVDLSGHAVVEGTLSNREELSVPTDTIPAGHYILRLTSRAGAVSTPVTVVP